MSFFFSLIFSETFEFFFVFSGEGVCISVFNANPSMFVCGDDSYLSNLWGKYSEKKRDKRPSQKKVIIPFEMNQKAPTVLFQRLKKTPFNKKNHPPPRNMEPLFANVFPGSPKCKFDM